MTVNYDFFDQITPEAARHVADQLREGKQPMPTRGAHLCTRKEMALQLAGFADTREGAVADGPAGAATLRGVRLAEQHGISVAGFDPATPIVNKPAADATPAGDAPKPSQQANKEAK
jgi:NADH-quinone oxidoreductase subunit E